MYGSFPFLQVLNYPKAARAKLHHGRMKPFISGFRVKFKKTLALPNRL